MDAIPLDISPFHIDEVTAQQKAGVTAFSGGIRPFMPDQHRLFFAGLRYVFISVADADGWPVAAVLTGEPGFIASPDPHTLQIVVHNAVGPAADRLIEGQQIGLLGLDLATRRRNRANGRITAISHIDDIDDIDDARLLTIAINQSFGNCPQYIQRRSVHPAPANNDSRPAPIETLPGLDAAARAIIAKADTLFVASRSRTDGPGGGADISHRGGRPGFVRIDGDDLWIPDFHGNNFFNTLGNLLGEPRAALVFLDFDSGAVLHLQGLAEVYWDTQARPHFDGAERFWRFRVQRGWRQAAAAALPLRWSFIDAAPTTLQTGAWHDVNAAANSA